jgi:hypothetical protein
VGIEHVVSAASKSTPDVWICLISQESESEDAGALLDAFKTYFDRKGYGYARSPVVFGEVLYTPSGDGFFVCHLIIRDEHSKPLVKSFCSETGRKYLSVTRKATVRWGGTSLDLRLCTMRTPTRKRGIRRKPISKEKEAKSISGVVALAKELLKARTCQSKDLKFEKMEDADDVLIREVYRRFRRRFGDFLQPLEREFGKPTTGTRQIDFLPVGVIQYAVWQVATRVLYLVVSHEDRDLPCSIKLGVTKATFMPNKAVNRSRRNRGA